jgi:hypothetical protein
MKVVHKDFIATYSDVYPEGYCSHLIKTFDDLEADGAGWNRIQSDNSPAHTKKDHQINLNIGVHHGKPFTGGNHVTIFFDNLQKCYEEYSSRYSVLQHVKIRATSMKMQKTPPGGGYHVWHAEQGNGNQSERAVVYMLYLNTLEPESAGETEFLYQQTRLRPVENTMILWPAAYTHAHRGNTVFGNTSKYIVTGWFYLD